LQRERDGEGVLDIFEGEGRGGVAGDDEEFYALFVEEPGAGDGVAGDGFAGFGAVGQACGITEIEVVRAGDERQKGAENGEAAEAGVEDANGDIWERHFCQCSVVDVGRGFGGGVFGRVGAKEIGMASEGVVGLAIDEEADLGDLREGSVEGADDRLEGEGFGLDAGGMVVDEGAVEIDDG
jgi:hypothetical protein